MTTHSGVFAAFFYLAREQLYAGSRNLGPVFYRPPSTNVSLASGKATLAGYLRCLHKREEKRYQKKAGEPNPVVVSDYPAR